jgi:hypothetical protein
MLPNMTVLQALSSAGLNQFSNTKRIYVLRTENGKQGSVYGLRTTVASASGAIGPAIGASIAVGLGYGAVFFATGAILAVAGLSTAVFARRGVSLTGTAGPGPAEGPTDLK